MGKTAISHIHWFRERLLITVKLGSLEAESQCLKTGRDLPWETIQGRADSQDTAER